MKRGEVGLVPHCRIGEDAAAETYQLMNEFSARNAHFYSWR